MRRLRDWRRWRAFGAETRGVTAVEFAMIGGPFFALLFAIMETSLVFYMSSALDDGLALAARDIRTNQFDLRRDGEDAFRANICGYTSALPSCASRIHLDVRAYDVFSDANQSARAGTPIRRDETKPDTRGEFDATQISFEESDAGDVVVVRAFYEWPIITPLIGRTLANVDGNKRVLSSVVVLRNEPF